MILKRFFWFSGTALLLLIIFLPGYTKLQEIRDKNRDLEARMMELGVENEALQVEIRRIESDSFYQEKVAREKMGVVRKGEIPVKIVPEEKE
ncbi:septum formation initiator family protein [Candidatus Omnitrophota bacterium]